MFICPLCYTSFFAGAIVILPTSSEFFSQCFYAQLLYGFKKENVPNMYITSYENYTYQNNIKKDCLNFKLQTI